MAIRKLTNWNDPLFRKTNKEYETEEDLRYVINFKHS